MLTQKLLEVEHCSVIFIPTVGEVSHHKGSTVILLVCPQESHARVLALVKIVGLKQKLWSSDHKLQHTAIQHELQTGQCKV